MKKSPCNHCEDGAGHGPITVQCQHADGTPFCTYCHPGAAGAPAEVPAEKTAAKLPEATEEKAGKAKS